MENLICDDRVDRQKLAEYIRNMTDEEFEEFQNKIKKTNTYPIEFYTN